MRKWYLANAVIVVGLLCAQQLAKADTVQTIGNPSNFTAGEIVHAGTFNTTVMAEPLTQPAPFNIFTGSNTAGPNFSATWMFTYSLPASSTITGATLTIGIVDSPWEGSATNPTPANTDQVAMFTLDTTDSLTAALNTEINTVGTGSNLYEVDTISIPGADLADLGSGSATFYLALQGPGSGVLGAPTPSLGAGLDFSTLDISTQQTVATSPEPSTWVLLCTGMLFFGIERLRAKRLLRC
jgi:hypothetical protein